MLFSSPFAALSLAALFVLGLGGGASAAPLAAWTQMTVAGAEARMVTTAAACPEAVIDGVSRRMVERAPPSEAFPGRVCAATLAPGALTVTVDGAPLRAVSPRPRRLVIIGDSGCRLKGGHFQDCNDPDAWPFARIAALAAARRPDLVIHLGDYYYREQPCPAWATPSCARSPYGDRWETWRTELFGPGAPLLAAAPWVFARGNHELCKRGANGWLRMLDAAATPPDCAAPAATFAVDLGGPVLWVVDGSDTDDFLALPDKTSAFAARVEPVLRAGGRGHAWIVTHRPVWNPSRLGDLVGDGLVNVTQRQALKGRDLSGVDLILSGHVHNFASVSFAGRRPSQLVDGAGGDLLDLETVPPPTTGTASVDGLPADIFTMGRFGYFVFDRHGADWIGRFYGLDDRVAATCLLRRRALTCKAEPAR